jgi:hypothetical protein
MYVVCRPTGWHSAAASAPAETFKSNDLAREAVCCNAVLDGKWLE